MVASATRDKIDTSEQVCLSDFLCGTSIRDLVNVPVQPGMTRVKSSGALSFTRKATEWELGDHGTIIQPCPRESPVDFVLDQSALSSILHPSVFLTHL